ncbi:MAG TPA: hypothetical protein VLJ88_09480, partial [Propionibacteriaceae bacterium]|nr:hypothetical protein [Propionibacteriaceae bacterium]
MSGVDRVVELVPAQQLVEQALVDRRHDRDAEHDAGEHRSAAIDGGRRVLSRGHRVASRWVQGGGREPISDFSPWQPEVRRGTPDCDFRLRANAPAAAQPQPTTHRLDRLEVAHRAIGAEWEQDERVADRASDGEEGQQSAGTAPQPGPAMLLDRGDVHGRV